MSKSLFTLNKLSVRYKMGASTVHALQDITLEGEIGKTIGIVGESGCGKSTLAKALLGLTPVSDGTVTFNNEVISSMPEKKRRLVRKHMQMVFQDPDASLNPRMTIFNHLKEALTAQMSLKDDLLRQKIDQLLDMVQLPHSFAKKYPHQLSGGQKQRACIARALSSMPQLIVCDEPLASLDISVSAQIIQLLKKLQHDKNLTYVFITHDLASLGYLADTIAVLYLGHLVEIASKESIYKTPLHPYTEALLSSVLIPDPEKQRSRSKITIPGELPSVINPPKGCVFHTRCPKATKRCLVEKPPLIEIKPKHFVACHLYT